MSRLAMLGQRVEITVHKDQEEGPDICVAIKVNGRAIHIEVQQDVSGKNWRPKTIPSWEERHDWYTFIVFTEPFLERVRKVSKQKKYPEYEFFEREDVFLASEGQVSEVVSLICSIVLHATAEV